MQKCTRFRQNRRMNRSVCRESGKSVFCQACHGIWSAKCENALWDIASERLLLLFLRKRLLFILDSAGWGDIKFAVVFYV